jgi:hypothetical protein
MFLLRKIYKVLLSLRTSLWLLGLITFLFIAGAVIMPLREEFQSIHSGPMLQWLKAQPPGVTWWLWAIMGLLSLLSINTLFCSVESIIKKRKVTQWLLLISPQIIHIGFLFMLVAHLLSAAGGSQAFVTVAEGSLIKVSQDKTVRIRDIRVDLDPSGYIDDWQVNIEYIADGAVIHRSEIRPNSPSVRADMNINVKKIVQVYPFEAVLLQVSREPGAFWALAGGILFTIGILILIVLRIKMEKQ